MSGDTHAYVCLAPMADILSPNRISLNSKGNASAQKVSPFFLTGITGELISGRADIAAFPLVQSPGRPDVIDLSLSYNEDGLGILVKKQVSLPSDLVLLPDLEITGEG